MFKCCRMLARKWTSTTMRQLSVRTFTLLVSCSLLICQCSSYGIQEYCEGEEFEAKCKRDEVIVMKTAYYGRMRLGRCVRMNMGYIGCEQDVLDLADQRCSGRNECKIKVPDTSFERTQPCFELKSYLEIEYTCMKVATARPQVCQTAKYVKLTSQSAYLASSVTQTTGCGSSSCPWVIEVPPGQRINISLVDFGWRMRKSLEEEDSMNTLQVCQKYAVLRELGTTKSITICGSAERQSTIYISESNQLEIYLTPKMASDGSTMHFLLKYEAIGCPNLTPPRDAYVKRHHDGWATVQCKYSGQNWRVQCRGMKWFGKIGNCTRHAPRTSGRFVIGNVSMPHGIAFAIVAGVAIVIGALILTVGLVIFKRHRRKMEGGHRTPLRPGSQSVAGEGGRCPQTDEYLPPPPPPSLENPDGHPTSPISKCPSAGRNYTKNEYTHIWEMPLPLPNEASVTVPVTVPVPVTCP